MPFYCFHLISEFFFNYILFCRFLFLSLHFTSFSDFKISVSLILASFGPFHSISSPSMLLHSLHFQSWGFFSHCIWFPGVFFPECFLDFFLRFQDYISFLQTYLQASANQSAAIYIEIVQLLFTVSKILFILVKLPMPSRPLPAFHSPCQVHRINSLIH